MAQTQAHVGNGMFQTRADRKFSSMPKEQSVGSFRRRWELASDIVDELLTRVEEGEFLDAEEVYPTIPLTIAGIVQNLYGFQPKGGLVETELATKAEHMIGSVLSQPYAVAGR